MHALKFLVVVVGWVTVVPVKLWGEGCTLASCSWHEAEISRARSCNHRQKLVWALLRWESQWQMGIQWNSRLVLKCGIWPWATPDCQISLLHLAAARNPWGHHHVCWPSSWVQISVRICFRCCRLVFVVGEAYHCLISFYSWLWWLHLMLQHCILCDERVGELEGERFGRREPPVVVADRMLLLHVPTFFHRDVVASSTSACNSCEVPSRVCGLRQQWILTRRLEVRCTVGIRSSGRRRRRSGSTPEQLSGTGKRKRSVDENPRRSARSCCELHGERG